MHSAINLSKLFDVIWQNYTALKSLVPRQTARPGASVIKNNVSKASATREDVLMTTTTQALLQNLSLIHKNLKRTFWML
jgi:hypothetical protein